MPAGARRKPTRRLLFTLLALASLIVGYYLGQAWQRQPLAGLSAVVYTNGRSVEYPAALGMDSTEPAWRLLSVADTREAACTDFVRHVALVMNRLAERPDIQQRLRLTVLAYDNPDADAITAFGGGQRWIEVISAPAEALDSLAGQLGLLPPGSGWCGPAQDNAILVAPDATAWALVPRESPASMAHAITTLIDFVE